MEWSRRILLQRELEAEKEKENNLKRMAKIIAGEPDKAERDIMLDLIAEVLGGHACEEISRMLRKDHIEVL